MSARVHQALAVLPADLADLAAQHVRQFPGDADDLLSELWIAAASAAASDTSAAIFKRARSAVRRARQAPLRWAPIENVKPADPRANVHDDAARGVMRWSDALITDPADPSPLCYADYVRLYAEQHRCTLRRAQQTMREMLRRWGEDGDLFPGAEAV